MKRKFLLPLVGAISLCALPGHSDNWVWMTWENEDVNERLCQEKALCTPITSYVTELHSVPELEEAERMMGAAAKAATLIKQLETPRNPPAMCQHVDAASVLGFDPEIWEMSEKALALVGLDGVHIDATKIKDPYNHQGLPFGERVQGAIAKKFREHGLKLLSAEEMEETPGKPEMNIYFSHANPKTGCQFKFFAGLSQTMLLTRNHTVKLKAGSWGMVGGWDEDDASIDEFKSIMIVIDAFLAAWREANDMQLVAVSDP